MSDLYKPQTLKLYAQQAGSVRLTLDWFANKAFYPPRAGVHIKPLINGQAVFDAVHAAMEAARHSIDIITWGFDPAMRFKRPDGPRIGELLQTKGREGVQARVLVWSNQLARLKENTIPGAGVGGSGGTWAGSGVASGSAVDNEVLRLEQRRQHNLNLIARQQEALERSERLHREGRLPSFDPRGAAHARTRIAELEAENAEIQRTLDSSGAQGYGGKRGSGGTRQDPWGQIFTRDWFKAVRGGGLQNVEFRTRDFEQTARPVMNGEQVRLVNGRLQSLIHLLRADGIDDLGIGQLLVLTQFASHHQKMVLVDYGSPQAIGFVMGHNMHRNYWDTSAHLFDDRAAGRDPGFGPWQDISMQVQGPVLADLSRNFSEAWDLETPWYKRWFSTPSLTAERDARQQQRRADLPNPATGRRALDPGALSQGPGQCHRLRLHGKPVLPLCRLRRAPAEDCAGAQGPGRARRPVPVRRDQHPRLQRRLEDHLRHDERPGPGATDAAGTARPGA
ncbi:hypothetical protein Q080_02142 [Pseudomonas aeruginosa M8A.1]|nr:hypothetical protein Q080_02142 [Pseudomonas aeruginosa M8A.1]